MSGDTTDLASVRARLRGVTATTAGDGTPTAVCLYIILCCSKGRHMLYLTYYLLSVLIILLSSYVLRLCLLTLRPSVLKIIFCYVNRMAFNKAQ